MAFALTLLCAVWLVHALAMLLERLPLAEHDGRPAALGEQPTGWRLSVARLARLQMALLGLGALAFLAWIVL